MLPGGQFSKKAASCSGRRLMRGEGVQGWKRSRGPRWTRGSRGVGGMSETIEAAPEAGRSFSGVCACGYFYSPPERHHRLGVLRSFLGWVLSPARRTPPTHPLTPPYGCRGEVGGCLDSSDSKGLYLLAAALAMSFEWPCMEAFFEFTSLIPSKRSMIDKIGCSKLFDKVIHWIVHMIHS